MVMILLSRPTLCDLFALTSSTVASPQNKTYTSR
jgi:hypothetical protein